MRIADVGDMNLKTAQRLLSNWQTFECPICGPCSHVELTWSFTVHSVHETLEDAQDAARAIDDAEPEKYRLEGIPKAEPVTA